MIKKIEDLDYYEILNLTSNASPKDVGNSYLLAVATYHQDSLASYGGLIDKERDLILDKIEAAYQTLRDPEKRKAYDAQVGKRPPGIPLKADFRSSTKPLQIEDASEGKSLWDKVRSVLASGRRRKAGRALENEPGGWGRWSAADDFYYYGDILKKLRMRKGLTLEDISKKCGVPPSRLQSLEEEIPDHQSDGEKMRDVLRRYAKCLGLDPDNGQESSFSSRFD
ncbi:MAG: helix-turn-helix domain-containing protein [Candidatus Aminicenantes bacterium]|nr:helix-turn-helix domain-containing protein [Candidatus Aminicenantes bacterium]